MAEFAKEAMKNQKLDGDEVISVKWSETDRFELSFQDHKEIVTNIKDQAKRTKTKTDNQELEPKEDDEFYQGKLSKDPSKVLMNAQFSIYEEKMRQAKKDQEMLLKSLKRVKRSEKGRVFLVWLI
jgi:hypothetical protein